MFKENKYYRWYFQIIKNAQGRVLDIYSETHHIIPRCLGGNDSRENLVELTAREHFICHWLLTKFVLIGKGKMDYALWLMINVENKLQERYKINSKTYEILRTKLSKTFSKQHTGRKMSEETKRKISETRKKKFKDGTLEIKVYDTTRKKLSKNRSGYKHTQETKDKIGNAHRGKVISDEQKQTLSEINTGKQWAEETRTKLSNTLKDDYKLGKRVPWNKGKTWSKGIVNG
jgi:NUMOD3 motif